MNKNGVSDQDAWEYCRLMAAPEMKTRNAKDIVVKWASNPGKAEHPFYETIQGLQNLEQSGKIHPMSHEDFKVHLFISRNLFGSDQATIYNMIESPQLFEECKRLYAEIIRPGSSINQPGKFIIAGLRKLQSTINHKFIK